MISTIAWAPSDAAKVNPDVYKMTKDEFNAVRAEMQANPLIGGGDREEEEPLEIPEELKEYNFDDYDNDTENTTVADRLVFENLDKDQDFLDDNEDVSAWDINAETDVLIYAGRAQDEFAIVNQCVYDTSDNHLYLHHDVHANAYPLGLAHIGFNFAAYNEYLELKDVAEEDPEAAKRCELLLELIANKNANYLAVASFSNEIEIWDMDLLDAVEPALSLGGEDLVKTMPSKAKNMPKKLMRPVTKKVLRPGSHTTAVLGVAWNALQKNLLASCSADNTVKIWDLTTAECVMTLAHHKDKVQSVNWHPTEPTLLLTASYDKSVCVIDVEANKLVTQIKLPADPESSCWFNTADSFKAVVSTENGEVIIMGTNGIEQQFKASDKTVSSVSSCLAAPGMLLTADLAGVIKVWKITDEVICVHTRQASTDGIMCMSVSPYTPQFVAYGSNNVELTVDNILSWEGVREAFNIEIACPNTKQTIKLDNVDTFEDDVQSENEDDQE